MTMAFEYQREAVVVGAMLCRSEMGLPLARRGCAFADGLCATKHLTHDSGSVIWQHFY